MLVFVPLPVFTIPVAPGAFEECRRDPACPWEQTNDIASGIVRAYSTGGATPDLWYEYSPAVPVAEVSWPPVAPAPVRDRPSLLGITHPYAQLGCCSFCGRPWSQSGG